MAAAVAAQGALAREAGALGEPLGGLVVRVGEQLQALKAQRPARIVVAVPIAPPDTCAAFREEVDEVVCAETPAAFSAVGQWYADFEQTTDEEVRELLRRARVENSARIRERRPTTPKGVSHF